RLGMLDVAEKPERSIAKLKALADAPGPRSQRAAALGQAAEASAHGGRFDEALALLDQAAALGPEGQASADAQRTEILGRWIAQRAAKQDVTGVATIYAAYSTSIDALATREDRLTVAQALGQIGLHSAAVRLLRRGAEGDVELATALAEEALAAGDVDTARATANTLLGKGVPADLAPRVRR